MKTGTNLQWVARGLVVACAGGLFSCEGAPKKEGPTSPGGTAQSQTDTLREEESSLGPSLEKTPFDSTAGAVPKNEAEYRAALQSIKTYSSENRKAIVTSNYFSDSLIRVLIGKEGSATDKKVSGLRVYRTYTLGSKGFGILIVPVDGKGVDLKTTEVRLKDGYKADYLFGTSQERCPDNCEGCALD